MAISSFDAMLEESYFHGALRELGNDLQYTFPEFHSHDLQVL